MVNEDILTMNETNRNIYVFKGSWFSLTRPLTLTGTLSPIIAGTIYALYINQINISLFIGLVLASVLIQSAVNMFNDYLDFRNGQDHDKWRISTEPLTFNQPSFQAIMYIATLLLLLAMGIGLWLVVQSNIWTLFIGITGIVCGVYYSFGTHSFSALGLGEVIAAIFLGIVPANLAFMIQGHSWQMNVFLVSLIFSLLIATMILTNNIRDLKKDAGFRKTIAIRLGYKKALILFIGILVTLYISVGLFIIFDIIPWQTIIVFLALPSAWFLYRSLGTGAKNMTFGCMQWAAWHHWMFSIMFIIGLCAAF